MGIIKYTNTKALPFERDSLRRIVPYPIRSSALPNLSPEREAGFQPNPIPHDLFTSGAWARLLYPPSFSPLTPDGEGARYSSVESLVGLEHNA